MQKTDGSKKVQQSRCLVRHHAVYRKKLGCLIVRLSGFLQGINKPHKFLGSMGNGNMVVLALVSLFGEVGGESRILTAN